MKPLIAAAIAWIAFGASPAAGQAFYLQIDGGAVFLTDNEVDDLEIDYEAGFAVGGRLGASLGNRARLELQLSYLEAEIDEVGGFDLGAVGLDADVSSLNVELAAYGDILTSGPIRPYAGGGLGVAFKEVDSTLGDDDDTGLTAHLEAGLQLDLIDHVAIVPHCRLSWFDGTGDDEQFAHMLRIGLRIKP